MGQSHVICTLSVTVRLYIKSLKKKFLEEKQRTGHSLMSFDTMFRRAKKNSFFTCWSMHRSSRIRKVISLSPDVARNFNDNDQLLIPVGSYTQGVFSDTKINKANASYKIKKRVRLYIIGNLKKHAILHKS